MITRCELLKRIKELEFEFKGLNHIKEKLLEDNVYFINNISSLENKTICLQYQLEVKPLYEIGETYGDYLIIKRECISIMGTPCYKYTYFDKKKKITHTESEKEFLKRINFK